MQLAADHFLPLAKRPISADEARQAIYIDFEGRINEPPVLLGELHGTGSTITAAKPVLRHYLLDPTFQQLHDAYNLADMYQYETRCESLGQALNEVIRLARSRDRLIVSWSQFDMRIVLELGLDGMLAEEFAKRYRDGKATAKRWQRDFHSDVQLAPTRSGCLHSLDNYMKLIGYELPDPSYGTGRTGDNLKEVRHAIERRGAWDNMTSRQQRRWIEVLNHNKHDCLALRNIVTRAATDLGEA